MDDYDSRLDTAAQTLRRKVSAVDDAEAALWLARMQLDAAVFDAVRLEELRPLHVAQRAGMSRQTVYQALKREAPRRGP